MLGTFAKNSCQGVGCQVSEKNRRSFDSIATAAPLRMTSEVVGGKKARSRRARKQRRRVSYRFFFAH